MRVQLPVLPQGFSFCPRQSLHPPATPLYRKGVRTIPSSKGSTFFTALHSDQSCGTSHIPPLCLLPASLPQPTGINTEQTTVHLFLLLHCLHRKLNVFQLGENDQILVQGTSSTKCSTLSSEATQPPAKKKQLLPLSCCSTSSIDCDSGSLGSTFTPVLPSDQEGFPAETISL